MIIGYDAKRVLHNFTGLGNYSRFVISNMRKLFPENKYLLFAGKRSYSEKLEDEFKNENLYVTNVERRRLWRTWRIIDDIREKGVNIYHGLSNELPFDINKTPVRSVVTIHDLIFLVYPQYYPVIDRIIYNIKAKYACRAADKIVAVSECTKRDIIRYYKIPPEKIAVVYQGCSDIFKQKWSEEEKEAVKKKHHLPGQYILSVGSIEERKNILLIIKAIRSLPGVHFVAVGGQRKYAKEVKEYIKTHRLEDRVHLKSGVLFSELPGIFQSASLFVYPSLYEGFGIPVVEALSSGIPVIAATGSCLEEAGGSQSVYVNPSDEHELAYQINRILSDRSLAQQMINEGYKYVERFSDKECAENMMKVYKSLVG